MNDDLIRRFVEDPDSLSEAELCMLHQRLVAEPDLAAALNGHLVVDALLTTTCNPTAAAFPERVRTALESDDFPDRMARRIAGLRRRTGQRPAKHRPLRLWLGYGAAAAVLLCAMLLALPHGSGQAELIAVGTGVVVERDDGLLPGATGLRLRAGDLLVIPAGTSATLRCPDGTILRGQANSRLRLLASSGQQSELEHGGVDAEVPRQPPGHRLGIGLGTARVEVLGTRFSVIRDGPSAELAVTAGRVRFSDTRHGHAIEVAAGERAVANDQALRLFPPQAPASPPLVTLRLEQGWEDGKGEWLCTATTVQQNRIAELAEDATSTMLFPCDLGASDSFTLSATIAVEAVTEDLRPGRGAWGFGMLVTAQPPGQQGLAEAWMLRTLQNSRDPSPGLEIRHLRNGEIRAHQSHGLTRGGAFKLRIAWRHRILHGRIWPADAPEPAVWQISAPITMAMPRAIGFTVTRCQVRISDIRCQP